MSTMPSRKPSLGFAVEWSAEAWVEMRTLPASERRPVVDAAAKLAIGRRRPVKAIPNAILEVRTRGEDRLLYRVVDPLRGPAGGQPRVQILSAIVTGATGIAVAPPGADELRRRGATLRKIGGGIPHEVVRRAWLVELQREEV
jgi:hypothetical protein